MPTHRYDRPTTESVTKTPKCHPVRKVCRLPIRRLNIDQFGVCNGPRPRSASTNRVASRLVSAVPVGVLTTGWPGSERAANCRTTHTWGDRVYWCPSSARNTSSDDTIAPRSSVTERNQMVASFGRLVEVTLVSLIVAATDFQLRSRSRPLSVV